MNMCTSSPKIKKPINKCKMIIFTEPSSIYLHTYYNQSILQIFVTYLTSDNTPNLFTTAVL